MQGQMCTWRTSGGDKARDVVLLQAKEPTDYPQLPHRTDSSSQSSQGTYLANTLICGFLALEL